MSTRQQWLESTQEEAIEPELPICDPHHHFFTERFDGYLLSDALQDMTASHRIMETVFVECSEGYRTDRSAALAPVGETDFVLDVIRDAPKDGLQPAAGIVGYADLTLGSHVAEVLQAHVTTAPDRFRGIRHSAAYAPGRQSYRNPPPELLRDASFRAGFACLSRFNLSFDTLVYSHQLPELGELAAAFPDTTIILDHIGMPLDVGDSTADAILGWKKGIADLAHHPNIVIKLGGLGMPPCGFGWHEQAQPPNSTTLARQTEPFYLWCIEQFGVDRCMFESNFPVDKVSYSYTVLWNSFKRMTADFAPSERAALFRDTALRVYRLETATAAS